MTALYFDLKNPIRGLFYYQTPEFGQPWMVPFEFPLYQGLVAGISHHTSLPLTAVGRMLSGVFLLLALYPIYIIFNKLHLGRSAFFFSAVFLLLSPLYLYWSRTFMIESTAIFFGLSFVALVCLVCSKWSLFIAFCALICGILCALVKATTFPSFGVAACLAAFAIFFGKDSVLTLARKTSRIFIVILGVCICILAALLWTRHADALKSLNPITSHPVSSSLAIWNYGPFEQRFTVEFWQKLVFERAIPEAIGSPILLVLLPIAFVFAKHYEKMVLVCLVGLFFLPMFLFSNLHIIHSYYQYANSFWLIFALGLSIALLAPRMPKWSMFSLALVVISLQLYKFSEEYYIPTTWRWHAAMDVGKKVDKETPKSSAILVAGDEWSPEVAFYSKRKAIYIPNWVDGYFNVNEEALVSALEQPEKLLGGLPLSAIIVRDNHPERTQLPEDRQQALVRLLKKMAPPLEEIKIKDYTLYLYQKNQIDEHPGARHY